MFFIIIFTTYPCSKSEFSNLQVLEYFEFSVMPVIFFLQWRNCLSQSHINFAIPRFLLQAVSLHIGATMEF
jgi:hypothetical protein